jgi:hypothetical protein
MDAFTQLFGNFLVFVYHCFDGIVIHGYLSALSRPEQVVHFFRQVVGVAAVDKEVLSRRTGDYQGWVEAYAHNHGLPIEWAEKGVRKEDHVLPFLRRMTRANRYGVYFIFKSMEQGSTFRITVPKYPTADPNYRILAHQRSASRIITSTSATKCSGRWSSALPRSFRSRPPIISTATASSSRNWCGRGSASARTTMPSWRRTMSWLCRLPPTG